MTKLQIRIHSPLGALYLVASAKGLSAICWERQAVPAPTAASGQVQQHLIQAERELSEYFSGVRQNFTVALDLEGTAFQKLVWGQLRKIPFGKTCSYQDVARGIDNEKACRAVGSANGKNPVAIIIPCHRVIAQNGTLGGYAGGLKKKSTLLEIERRNT